MYAQKLLMATIAGFIAGAVMVLLIAPAPGGETRKKISGATGKLKKRLSRLIGKPSDELGELKDIIQNQSDGLSEDTRQRVLKLIASTKPGYSNAAR
jgi:gas vesicle protein